MYFGNLVFQKEVNGVEVWVNHEINKDLDGAMGGGCATRLLLPQADGIGAASERAVAVIGLAAVTNLPDEQLKFVVLHEVGHILGGHINPGHPYVAWRDEPEADLYAIGEGACARAAEDFLTDTWEKFKATKPNFILKAAVWCISQLRFKQLQSR
jgi:hypothetical protein